MTAPRNIPPLPNRPLLLLAIAALTIALWAGLQRIGWAMPMLTVRTPAAHGPLMISGFLGTLIGLERAVAGSQLYGWRWLYALPVLSGSGALLGLAGLPAAVGQTPIFLAAVGLSGAFVLIYRKHPANHSAIMLAGALSWAVGNGLWLGGASVPGVVWWWAAFLLLTVVGERLELSRLTRPSRTQQNLLTGLVGLLIAGLVWAQWDSFNAVRLVGLAMIGLALWLLRHDIARRTVRRTGVTRFAAACMLSGYGWLLAAGVLAATFGGVPAGLRYDAMLHALFLGFIMSMIFGHAPIIFPSVLGLPLGYHPSFYTHLVLLHATLLLRVTGDLLVWMPGRRIGGLLNVLVILLFLFNNAAAIRRGRSQA